MMMEIAALVASALVFLAFFMKTMIPLRIVAIISNLAFILYALLGLYYRIFGKVFPILVLHLSLLPLNLLRLHQMRTLIRKVRQASADEPLMESLIPYMTKEAVGQGQALFRKGEVAEKIYFIQEGSVTIAEIGKELTAGTVFGEVGLFTPQRTRTASAICARPSVILSIHRDKVLQLYYQNPRFGFFIVRLLSRYISENVDTIVEFQNRRIHPLHP